jgi:tetratricopeptide (TPR) repeat protein
MTYLSIPDMPMMQDEKYKAQMPKDSTYLLYKYYTGRFAYANKNYDEAIRLFSDLVDGETENISSAEHIYQCYIDKGDSAKANEMLDIYIEKFPKEQWFMQNRINNLVSSGNTEAALVYLDKAIERAPQGQYYNSKASILSLMKRFEESLVSFEKALAMEPNNALFHQSYGYAYVDWGNMIYDAAQDLSAKEFDAELKKANEKFMQALPYFEKAYELEPENPDYKRTLRSLYYRLQMMDKYEALAN